MTERSGPYRPVRLPSPVRPSAPLQARARCLALQRARRRARQRRRLLTSAVVLLAVALVAWSLSSSSPASRKKGTALVTEHVNLPVVELSDPVSRATGSVPSLPFPSSGEGAVAVLGSGVVAESRHEREVPIASMTKMMTAYLVLKAHPLSGDEKGPIFHFTARTHREWLGYAESDESNVDLVAGESLDERQLLEALLIPSADNVADIFARWVSGTEANFVSLMNKTALSLGMTETHYADASGVDPHTVSTAANQALLAATLMENPVVRSIVRLQSVAFPVEGRVWNYNPALGVDGIVGIKSGFTSEANGCLATAAWRRVGTSNKLLVAVATGQVLGLDQAAQVDEDLLQAATAHLRVESPFSSDHVARVVVPWTHRSVIASIAAPLSLSELGGLSLSVGVVGARVTARQARDGWRKGAVVADLVVRSQFGLVAIVPLRLDGRIHRPPSPIGVDSSSRLPAVS